MDEWKDEFKDKEENTIWRSSSKTAVYNVAVVETEKSGYAKYSDGKQALLLFFRS